MPQTHTLALTTDKSIVTQALWVIGFAALTAVGAQIEIPHSPVPDTLQTLFVLLSGAMLGRRNGALSQGLYLAAGSLGLPVFSGFGFGIARLLGPTGGYLFGFPVAAFAVGYLLSRGKGFLRMLASMAAGLFIIFTLGTLQLNFLYFHNWSEALANGFLLFSWWDCTKLVAAASIATLVTRGRLSAGNEGDGQ